MNTENSIGDAKLGRAARQAARPEPLEVVHGSGNVYRDFGYPDADALQLKAMLATQIIKTLDREKLGVRRAQSRTGIAAADFSRIRNADLKHFTLERLMGIVNKLGLRVEVLLKIKPMAKFAAGMRSPVPISARPKTARQGAPKANMVSRRST